jgi:hypothetical protein
MSMLETLASFAANHKHELSRRPAPERIPPARRQPVAGLADEIAFSKMAGRYVFKNKSGVPSGRHRSIVLRPAHH